MNEKSFSKKKIISDYLVFDWKSYIHSYEDLSEIETKEEAWYHWINYGKLEGRVIHDNLQNNEEFEHFEWETYIRNYDDLSDIETKEQAWNHWISYGKNEKRIIFNLNDSDEFDHFDWETYVNNYYDLISIESKEDAWKHWILHGKKENRITNNLADTKDFKDFNWEMYVNNYDDLAYIFSKEDAFKHWINHGKKEGRICENIYLFDDYNTFEWKKYINNYQDLTYIDSKEEAWKHFILYGFNEGRKLNDLNEIELNNFHKIISVEGTFEEDDFSMDKIYFKKKYTNCGKHFFGWESSINYLLDHFTFENSGFHKKYYFDEWVEKLLVWGNKIQNKKCIDMIHDKKMQLITFLHGPPFESYNDFKNKDLILNDPSLLNKNIVDLIHSSKLFYSMTFLYVLSIHHKNYIIHTYPQLKNKVVSVYHPIDINNYQKDELFDVNKFVKNKNIYHIGWWLRNFTTFCNFKVPKGYNKIILLKQEFKEHFHSKFTQVDKSISIMNELNDNEYKNIFNTSCVFCDLMDAVANNVVLECMKYNTPIIVRRIPTIEEYLGVNYPLFFDTDAELTKFSDKKILHNKIVEASQYLQKMDKTPFMLETFLNKISYDINKLQVKNESFKLTWLYYLKNEDDDIETYMTSFKSQLSIDTIQLIIVNAVTTKVKLLESYKCDTITIINIEPNVEINDVYNIFIENTTTEYVTFTHFNCKENYSDLCINYFENNPTFDVVIFKENKMSVVKENIQVATSKNNYESEEDKMSEVNENLSEVSTNLSDEASIQLSEASIQLSDTGIELTHKEVVNLSKDDEEIFQLENHPLDNESVSEETELENTNDNDIIVHNNEELLTSSQIDKYNFHNKNILWRTSIHSYITHFDETFWLRCHKNHFNIFEISYNN
jgi:hypothetical protein